jgi:hypothetical protein
MWKSREFRAEIGSVGGSPGAMEERSMLRGRDLLLVLLGCSLVVIGAVSVRAGEGQRLDEGLLDPAWFGPGVDFRKTDDIDYVWVKQGFTVKGRKLFIDKWPDPVFLGEERNAKDSSKAMELTELMPTRLRGALSASLAGIAEVSRDDGDIVVSGRFVDCNAGSKAKKMLWGYGAGKAYATWDIKFSDKATHELLVAIHHRSVSGTAMSDIEDKIAKWLEKFGEALKTDMADVATARPAKG